ncbi:hypothetical protein [uncultured Draconibacterium sp.]|uniref:hypothetical protein n=1 Tax=uncultured Draconibacterium sp. TaxID=1573823 RepID=UPI00326148FD
MKQTFNILLIWVLMMMNNVLAQDFSVDKRLNKASVLFSNGILKISTGRIERTWKLSETGFQTISFKNLESGKEWAKKEPVYSSDWNLPKRIKNGTKGELKSINCIITDDEKFTSEHLSLEAEFEYAEAGLSLKFLVRVYPESPGVWTALEVRSLGNFFPDEVPEDVAYHKSYGSSQPLKIARNEFIPVDFSQPNQRRYWGLYNDPGNRVNTKDMVKEKVIKGFPVFQDEQNTWASGIVVESGNEGLIVVKESNKTVNKYGHQTGCFYATPNGLEVTGWGLKPSEITNEYKRTWATWSILYQGDNAAMQLALKRFDRTRYPVVKERDMHILIDTWGSDLQNNNYKKLYGRENSAFEVVEKEIKSAADLGIDIVRIDDGWQEGGTLSKNSWHPNPKVGYSPHWEKTKKLADEHHVQIGLWAAIRFITPEELLDNFNKLNVATWKFDFDKLEDHDSFLHRFQEIRNFIKETDYQTQTSWCPEYDDQRYGWYSPARECGPMYFQNIQNNLPNHIVYVPYITLRHHWMMAKYFNMNDLQGNWQNPARTNPKFSDANQHSQTYCALSALMTSPSAFMLTQFLEKEERNELRSVISIYKQHRGNIYDSYIFPIGEEPNNASYTGFQAHNPNSKTGYLMLFRELHNKNEDGIFNLEFLRNQTLEFEDLLSGKKWEKKLEDGKMEIRMDKPATCKFLKYNIKN